MLQSEADESMRSDFNLRLFTIFTELIYRFLSRFVILMYLFPVCDIAMIDIRNFCELRVSGRFKS